MPQKSGRGRRRRARWCSVPGASETSSKPYVGRIVSTFEWKTRRWAARSRAGGRRSRVRVDHVALLCRLTVGLAARRVYQPVAPVISRRSAVRRRAAEPGRALRIGQVVADRARSRSGRPARRPARCASSRGSQRGVVVLVREDRLGVRPDAGGEDRRASRRVDRRLVELVDEVEVVERLDAAAVEARSPRRARAGRRRRSRSPASRRAGHALPQAGQDAAGRRRISRISEPGARPTRKIQRRRGRGGTSGSRARSRVARICVQLLEVHEVVDAGEERATRRSAAADLRVDERARRRSRGRRPSGRPLDQPLALRDLANERRAIAVGRAGDPRDDGRGVHRPASRRGERCGHAQPDARLAVVTDALGDIPVRFPAGQRERRVGQRFDDRGQRRSRASRAARRWPLPCRDRRDDGPRDGPRAAGPSRCRAMPRRCRVRPVRAHPPQARLIGDRSP